MYILITFASQIKRMTKFLYIIGLLLLTAMSIKAQQTPKMSAYILRGSITNGDDATAVVGATVRLFQQNKLVGGNCFRRFRQF